MYYKKSEQDTSASPESVSEGKRYHFNQSEYEFLMNMHFKEMVHSDEIEKKKEQISGLRKSIENIKDEQMDYENEIERLGGRIKEMEKYKKLYDQFKILQADFQNQIETNSKN